MNIYSKILENTPPSGFVGGMIKMIVGPIGVKFSVWGIKDNTAYRTDCYFKEGDFISIIRVKDGVIYVAPFIYEIPFYLANHDIKGLLISKYEKTY